MKLFKQNRNYSLSLLLFNYFRIYVNELLFTINIILNIIKVYFDDLIIKFIYIEETIDIYKYYLNCINIIEEFITILIEQNSNILIYNVNSLLDCFEK